MEVQEALAVVVRAVRRGRGFSQEDLSSVDRSYLSRIERGEVSITVDVLGRLASDLQLDPATLILMATSLQTHEPFGDRLKSISKQLEWIKKEGIDTEIDALALAGKLPPGRPSRSDAARKAIEATRLRSEGMAVAEIAQALGLSEATVRRYLKTAASLPD